MHMFSKKEQAPPVQQQPSPPKKHGLFHSHREPSPVSSASSSSMSGGSPTTTRESRMSSLFRSSHDTNTTASTAHSVDSHGHPSGQSKFTRGLNRLGGGHEMDPSILRAREHVVNAEAAERDADRALDEARRRVKEARQHVKTLEDEAREEARLAKIKQHHAAEVSKRGKGLGRHDI